MGAVAVALAVGPVSGPAGAGHTRTPLDGARTSALAAARTYAVELAGYNYRHLDRDFGGGRGPLHAVVSSGASRSRATPCRPRSTKYHATADAKVVSAGIVSASTTRAVALVFLNQKITNSTQSAPTTDRSQVEITLVNSGGRWLIDQVSLL